MTQSIPGSASGSGGSVDTATGFFVSVEEVVLSDVGFSFDVVLVVLETLVVNVACLWASFLRTSATSLKANEPHPERQPLSGSQKADEFPHWNQREHYV